MRKSLLLIVSIFILCTIPMNIFGQTYKQLWKQVTDAEEKALPQSAIKVLDEIFQKALKEKNPGQMLYAYTYRAEKVQRFTLDSFYVNIRTLEEWADSPTVDHLDCAVLHTIIANEYAQYASDNQWQLRQRTDIAEEEPSADMREWSGNMFVNKVINHAQMALVDSLLLLEASTKQYIPFVIQKDGSAYYHHDMYHLLAQQSLMALVSIVPLEKNNEVTNAINTLYDKMIATYKQRGNTDGVLLASLDRLSWQQRFMTTEQYLEAIDELISEYSNSPLIPEAYLAKLSYLLRNDESAETLKIVDYVIDAYPGYPRINAFKLYRDVILNPSLIVTNKSKVYPDEDFEMSVTHRNLKGFTLNFYKVNLPADSEKLDEPVNDNFKKAYTTFHSTKRFELTPSELYKNADTVLTVRAPEMGIYIMEVVPDVQPGKPQAYLLSSTRLTLLSRKLPDGRFETVALDAKSGHPVADARIRFFDNVSGKKVEVGSFTTNKEGKINVPYDRRYRYMIADKADDSSMMFRYANSSGYYSFSEPESDKVVALLTDRAIYRPGQTVYLKGISYRQKEDTARIIENKRITVTLYDANYKEVSKTEVRTNEFGSFTTEFVLPTGALNGYYTIEAENSDKTIRVEEYKRPTFDITFEKQEGTYSLGDAIELKGNVKTYSGIAVQDIPVKYTVNRSFNSWRWRTEPPVLIASGEVSLNNNGEFVIPVTLDSDENTKNLGYYTYSIEASVTNLAGETQSTITRVAAGERSILLNAEFKNLINKDDSINVTFSATNLNGQPVSVSGEYKVFPVTDYKRGIPATQPVYVGKFVSNVETDLRSELGRLPSGTYKIVASAKDDKGRDAEYETRITLFSINETRPPVEISSWYYEINTEFDREHPASFIFGTSYTDAYIMVDVFSGNKHIESRALNMSNEVRKFEYPYKKEYGSGVLILFTFVKNDIFSQQEVRLTKRIAPKELNMKWEVFRDNLRPGQKEEWKLTIKNPQGNPADAEMLAYMYDASLDKIWSADQRLRIFYDRMLPYTSWVSHINRGNSFNFWFELKNYNYKEIAFDRFWNAYLNETWEENIMLDESVVTGSVSSRSNFRLKGMSAGIATSERVEIAYSVAKPELLNEVVVVRSVQDTEAGGGTLPADDGNLRTNFSETAFFYPQLRTNEKGEVVLSFTMPESLTRWKFQAHAHTKGMLTGYLEGETVTSKEFMLTPNMPRFVRVGDKTSIAATIANLTGKAISGTAVMTLFDPATDKVISTQKSKFKVEAGKTTAVDFTFTATDKYEVLGCRLVADGGRFSDGEQHLLPVLSNKEYITETIAIPLKGNQTKQFDLTSLFNNNSSTATNRKLTVEFSGNPAWYAVQVLPSLSLPVNDNAVSWASAYYANSLAAYIVNTNPRIKTVFDTWKAQGGTKETFLSNLQKNQELKTMLLEETPWVMEADSEAERMQRIATLFDLNNIKNGNITAINKLRELQLNSGGWTWFSGMSESRYITSYVMEVLGRLAVLTGKPLEGEALSMWQNGLGYLNREIMDEYTRTKEAEKQSKPSNTISSTALDYLYGVAISGREVPKEPQTYFIDKLARSVTTLSVKDKARAAVILQKAGRVQEANDFVRSLKEHAVTTDTDGMYFAFNESPYTWLGLSIPAHVAAMEAFDVVTNDTQAVEEMKVWLLRQKQTRQWDSPVSTVNAIYALLNRGGNVLESRGDIRISVAGKTIETLDSSVQSIPGLSYIKEVFTDRKTLDNANEITAEKRDAGIAWGAVYAQYLEDTDKVQQRGGELNVDKKMYVERVEGTQKNLVPVTADTQLRIGDKVVSRITIRLDRAMDFVQLKDQRGACFEPIQTLSGYTWRNGIGYYISVKDASTNFFFDSLGKGVYVLEYSYRVARAGEYEGGMAVIQSAYAPEYTSHSASMKVKVTNE